METFRSFVNTIVRSHSHRRALAAGESCLAIVLAVGGAIAGVAAPARADFLSSNGLGQWVWNGGMATNIGGMWIGSGWDSFPGVNPPWNPVSGTAPPTPWETGLGGSRSIGGYRGGCAAESGFGRGLPAGGYGLAVPMPDPQVVVVPIVVVPPQAPPRPRFYAPGDECCRGSSTSIFGSESAAPYAPAYAPAYAPPPLPKISPAQDNPFWGARLMNAGGTPSRSLRWP